MQTISFVSNYDNLVLVSLPQDHVHSFIITLIVMYNPRYIESGIGKLVKLVKVQINERANGNGQSSNGAFPNFFFASHKDTCLGNVTILYRVVPPSAHRIASHWPIGALQLLVMDFEGSAMYSIGSR